LLVHVIRGDPNADVAAVVVHTLQVGVGRE